jgi:hypothetical protein
MTSDRSSLPRKKYQQSTFQAAHVLRFAMFGAALILLWIKKKYDWYVTGHVPYYSTMHRTWQWCTCQLPVMALSLQFSIPQKLQVYLAMYHEIIPVITVSWAMWTGFFRFFQPTFLRVRDVFRGRRGVMPGPWLGYGYGSELDSPMIGPIWTKICWY